MFVVLACLGPVGARAQQSPFEHDVPSQPDNHPQTTLSVRATLVEVPVLVKTKKGQIVFELTADDFVLTDDGAPQQLRLETDTDAQPLALALVVQTGGAGARHLVDYEQLDAVLDALVGNVEHRVTLIGFDSRPHLLMAFTHNTADVSKSLSQLNPGDDGAAILDGVAKAVDELRAQPPRFRRAILLLSETNDQGSTTSREEALRLISDANITTYSFGFSSTKAAVSHEKSKFRRPGEPGPAHGCFSRDGTDPVSTAEYEGHYSRQVLDCISDLAPPLRLATMAWIAATDGLKKNTTASVAQLTGGEFAHFHDATDLKAGLVAMANDVPNYYVLTFRPTVVTPGLHALHLVIRDRPQLVFKARSEYWIDGEQP